MQSLLPSSSGGYKTASVAVLPGRVRQENFPDSNTDVLNPRLFRQHRTSEVSTAFSHSNIGSRATVPVMLKHISEELKKPGYDETLEASRSLSRHSAPLVSHAVSKGLVEPPQEQYDYGEYPGNYNGILVTNPHTWEDEEQEQETDKPRRDWAFKEVSSTEINKTKEKLREQLRGPRKIKTHKGSQGTISQPDYKQLQLPL